MRWELSSEYAKALGHMPTITKTLGYLPLALVYAGRAIMDGLRTLQDYVRYYTTS